MTDIKNPMLLWIKGVLFLGLGILAACMLLLEAPHVKVALLLCVSVWAFCRAYYFAFYVIEHHVDPGFRYRGLFSLACTLTGRRTK